MAGSPNITIVFDDAKLRQMLTSAPRLIEQRFRRLLEAGAIDFQRREREEAPVGATGQLRNRITYTVSPFELLATIQPTQPYAEAVENGSRPHWVSAAPGSDLARWANIKGVNPYAVQHAIATRGTKANPFVQRTYTALKDSVANDIVDGLGQLVAELDNG